MNDDIAVWKSRCYLGLFLMALSLIMPLFFNAKNFGVLSYLSQAILNTDGVILIYTAARLVFLNTIRALPLYLGAFLLGQGISVLSRRRVLTIILPLALIPLIYYAIDWIHGIEYDFGWPAVLNMAHILVLSQMLLRLDRSYKKLLVVIIFLFGVQWLDVAPILTSVGFGRGEISMDVKMVAAFLEVEYFLNLFTLFFAAILILNSVLVNKFMLDQHLQAEMFHMNQQQTKRLQELKVQAIQARSLLEVQQLAHDLKNPLTIIQGLASFLSMKSAAEKEITSRISKAADNMEAMISEILYPEKRMTTSLKDLIYFIKTQLLPIAGERRLQIEEPIPDINLWANKLRLCRALVNIIENGLKAKKDGQVKVFFEQEKASLRIYVTDYGPGIAPEDQEKIWEAGFSTRTGATGLGLSFAQQVIVAHQGEIFLEQNNRQGASFVIELPIYNHSSQQ